MVEEYLVLFNFQSYSFRGEKILHDLGIIADFIPTPRKYGELCATSLRVRGVGQEQLEKILQENVITYAGIYPYTPSKLLKDFAGQEEPLSPQLEAVMGKIREDIPLKREDIIYLFSLTEPKEIKRFFQLAGMVRDNNLNKEIQLWALIRLQQVATGEGLTKIAVFLEKQGVKFLILELGDLQGLAQEKVLQTIKFLQERTALKLVISGGSNLFQYYAALQKAGVPYVLKHITLEEREALLSSPQEILDEILFLWHEGKNSLFGFSPLLPMPYKVENSPSLVGRKITALLRVLFKDAFLPAFNCVSSLDLEEQLAQLEVGANQLLLDFTLEVKDELRETKKLKNIEQVLQRRGYQIQK